MDDLTLIVLPTRFKSTLKLLETNKIKVFSNVLTLNKPRKTKPTNRLSLVTYNSSLKQTQQNFRKRITRTDIIITGPTHPQHQRLGLICYSS